MKYPLHVFIYLNHMSLKYIFKIEIYPVLFSFHHSWLPESTRTKWNLKPTFAQISMVPATEISESQSYTHFQLTIVRMFVVSLFDMVFFPFKDESLINLSIFSI